MPESALHEPILRWYAANARVLPWRRPGAGGWEVLVSEVMLQQTPVARVLPAYTAWMERWPDPAALAVDEPAEAIRMWGTLGYPRRALRLHTTARVLVDHYGGTLPDDVQTLRELPGIGDYTANAILAFAYRRRATPLDTNVRRVLGRVVSGRARPPTATRRDERELADDLLPDDPERAATWSVAVMELGALVCTARSPRCPQCPVAEQCRWLAAGSPPATEPSRRQSYEGTDRQCRGAILRVLREADGPVPRTVVDAAWPDPAQRDRALLSLVADGLVDDGEGECRLAPPSP